MSSSMLPYLETAKLPDFSGFSVSLYMRKPNNIDVTNEHWWSRDETTSGFNLLRDLLVPRSLHIWWPIPYWDIIKYSGKQWGNSRKWEFVKPLIFMTLEPIQNPHGKPNRMETTCPTLWGAVGLWMRSSKPNDSSWYHHEKTWWTFVPLYVAYIYKSNNI